ncbi:MAG: hypothetical protein J6O04_09315 [Selenomonadaceae bacterium]|nr:hypothetical protein [Selenomonadaceae bacterium]
MFSAAELKLIRENCPDDLLLLLKKLNVKIPDWENNDEFKIADNLYDEITANLSGLMKSKSVISGYTDLLILGNIPYKYSETDYALLNKVVENKNAIIKGATQPKKNEVKARAASESPKRTVKRVTAREPLALPTIIGGAILIGGIAVMVAGHTAGVAGVILGGAGVALGLKGQTVVKEVVTESPQTMSKETSTVITTPAAFTQLEINKVFDVLSLANKIIKSI